MVTGTVALPESDIVASASGHSHCRGRANKTVRGELGPGRPGSRSMNGAGTKGLSTRAASRGTLSPRQKQDIVFIAEIAASKGLSMEMHGVKVGPQVTLETGVLASKGKAVAAKQGGEAAREARQMRLSETDGSSATTPPTQQRSTDRLREFQEKIIAAKWLRLVKKLGHLAAHLLRSPIHCDFLASRIAIRGKMLDFMKRTLAHYAQRAIAPPAAQAFTVPDEGTDSPAPLLFREQVPWHELLDEDMSTTDTGYNPEVFGPGSFSGITDELEIEEERQLQLAIEQSMASPPPSPAETKTLPGARAAPPPAKSKTRGGRSKR